MKRIILFLAGLSLLSVPAAQAGNAGAWFGGAAIGSLATVAVTKAAHRPRYERPVEVREVHYTTVPVQTTNTSSAQTEIRRLQRELNAIQDENVQLNQELREALASNRELQRQNRELQKQLNAAYDAQTDLQSSLNKNYVQPKNVNLNRPAVRVK